MRAYHVAGIIPVNSQPMDFQFPWHDCLTPIAPNFLSIERAILECATAGCETIWIACPYGIQPLLRKRIGDTVEDPTWYRRSKYIKFKEKCKKDIPIYYIPVHPKDQDKRDSIVWNMLYACSWVDKLSSWLSKWARPEKYYICFPNAVLPSQFVRKYRHDIAKKRRFLISHQGRTILDGEYLSGTFTFEDIKFLLKEFKRQATGLWDPNSPKRDGLYPTERLPLENRYSGRFLTIADIFSKLPQEEDTKIMNIEWYYDISCWKKLKIYLSSEHSDKMKRPYRKLLKHTTLKGIAALDAK